MNHPSFDDLTDVYEALVDWPARLSREAPFYRRLFASVEVRSVVDVACGTGHHAALFHSWDLQVEGSDISPSMIQRAHDTFGEPPGLRWKVRAFDAAIDVDPPVDAVICVGNSLALAADPPTVKTAVREMLRAVRPGGLAVLHVINLWSLPDGPCVWQKFLRMSSTHGDTIVVKGMHRCGSQGYVDLVLAPAANLAASAGRSVPFLGLRAAQLVGWAREAGAQNTQCFGHYGEATFDQAASSDLIVVLRK